MSSRPTESAEVRLPHSVYAQVGKRLFDAIVGTILLILTAPLQGIIASLVRLKLGSPVLFRQERPGLEGTPFQLVKFRTMTDERDTNGELLSNEQRLTPFGRRLRSTSLDELPELLNVVRGDMSLVGPRPLLTQYLDRYSSRQRRRHEVRPGVTGLAQVSGRNSLSWEEKFELDVQYVEHVSLAMDLGILARTLWQVATRRGISAEGHATMPEFQSDSDPA